MNKLKKGWWALALLAMVCLAAACGSDDGVMDRPDRTQVRYKLSLGSGWLQLYDVTVDYRMADGQLKTHEMKEDNWEFEDKVDGRYTRFTYRVTANAKRTTFDPNDSTVIALLAKDKELTYTYEFNYYEKVNSAHRINPEAKGSIIKAGDVAAYVTAHPQITLLEHDIQVK